MAVLLRLQLAEQKYAGQTTLFPGSFEPAATGLRDRIIPLDLGGTLCKFHYFSLFVCNLNDVKFILFSIKFIFIWVFFSQYVRNRKTEVVLRSMMWAEGMIKARFYRSQISIFLQNFINIFITIGWKYYMLIWMSSCSRCCPEGHVTRYQTTSLSSSIYFCSSFLIRITSFLQHSHH